MTPLARLLADESGATLVEYAVISAVLSLSMIAALLAIATECATRLSVTGSHMTALGTNPP